MAKVTDVIELGTIEHLIKRQIPALMLQLTEKSCEIDEQDGDEVWVDRDFLADITNALDASQEQLRALRKQMKQTSDQPDECRAVFEKWAQSKKLPTAISNHFINAGAYAHQDTHVAWLSWQAARELKREMIYLKWNRPETMPKDGSRIWVYGNYGLHWLEWIEVADSFYYGGTPRHVEDVWGWIPYESINLPTTKIEDQNNG